MPLILPCRHLLTYYGLAPNCFLYKTGPDEPENHCTYKEGSAGMTTVMGGSYADNSAKIEKITMKLDIVSPGTVIRDIAGISPAAYHLARGRPPPKPPREPLVDPTLKRKKRKKKKGGKKK